MLKVTKVWVHPFTSGKLLGFADIQMSLDGSDSNHMQWKGIKIFQGNNGSIWVALPSVKDEKGNKDDSGKDKYYPVISLSKEEDNSGPASMLLEHIRSEVEKEYIAKKSGGGNGKKKTQTTTQGGTGDDDIPW